jgi:hypothetical protein
MNANDEMLHRLIDNELPDDDMRDLFGVLQHNRMLREQFRSLLDLTHMLHAGAAEPVPATLDKKVEALFRTHRPQFTVNASPIRKMFARKIRVPLPAFAAAILLILLGSYFTLTALPEVTRQTEYVYVVEMPPYVVQSTVYDVVNN